jgi:hypothetical protein
MSEKFDDIMDVVGGNQSVTYVTFIQDHSGSMKMPLHSNGFEIPAEPITRADFQRDNYNEQIEVLRRETDKMETLVTLIEFDDKINIRYENVPCKEAIDLADYWVGGMTALYDAVGMAIRLTEMKMDADHRENKAALVIVQTDGQENASQEWGQKQLLAKVKELEETKQWTFVFLGEGIDQDRLTTAVGSGNVMAMSATLDSYNDTKGKTMRGISNYYTMRKAGATYTSDFTNNDQSKWEAKSNEQDSQGGTAKTEKEKG